VSTLWELAQKYMSRSFRRLGRRNRRFGKSPFVRERYLNNLIKSVSEVVGVHNGADASSSCVQQRKRIGVGQKRFEKSITHVLLDKCFTVAQNECEEKTESDSFASHDMLLDKGTLQMLANHGARMNHHGRAAVYTTAKKMTLQ
jgi:hypothetical protein